MKDIKEIINEDIKEIIEIVKEGCLSTLEEATTEYVYSDNYMWFKYCDEFLTAEGVDMLDVLKYIKKMYDIETVAEILEYNEEYKAKQLYIYNRLIEEIEKTGFDIFKEYTVEEIERIEL